MLKAEMPNKWIKRTQMMNLTSRKDCNSYYSTVSVDSQGLIIIKFKNVLIIRPRTKKILVSCNVTGVERDNKLLCDFESHRLVSFQFEVKDMRVFDYRKR